MKPDEVCINLILPIYTSQVIVQFL